MDVGLVVGWASAVTGTLAIAEGVYTLRARRVVLQRRDTEITPAAIRVHGIGSILFGAGMALNALILALRGPAGLDLRWWEPVPVALILVGTVMDVISLGGRRPKRASS